jgi:hypothetical protein
MATPKRGRPPQAIKKRGTTVNLPVDLIQAAKIYAIRHNTDLSATITKALTKHLKEERD